MHSTMKLGEAMHRIQTNLGEDASTARVIEPENSISYQFADASETFNMQSTVYLREGWMEEGAASGCWVLLRLGMHPLIVFSQGRAESSGKKATVEPKRINVSVSIHMNGHEFDPLDQFWICACGERNDPDQHSCSCGELNPFLGVVI